MKNEETSYPRGKIRILLLENVSGTAADAFRGGGYAGVERLPRALGEDELAEAVRGVHILGIRSKTKVTERVLASADRLLAVGCFCIGINVLGQYLKTNDRVGYVILDVDTRLSREAVGLLRGAKGTIKTRVVY